MKQISKIDLWAVRISVALILIIFLKTCTTNTRIIKSEEKLIHQIDSLTSVVNHRDSLIRREIKVEGLRSEKRMIQSTDRKLLDVTRQSEIDKEISELEK
jgi:hypothetical protein